MRFICPKCENKFSRDQSRYDIWDCPSCQSQFRGIHCDVDTFDYWTTLIPINPKFWFTAIFDRSYDIGTINKTKCPFCNELLSGENGESKNGWWPTVCCHCSSQLPKDRIQEDQVVEPFVETKKEAKKDYKKLMDLLNKL